MRTTVDIDDDVLQAAKELATREKSTAGRVISNLARRALVATPTAKKRTKNAVPVLPRRGDTITLDHVRKLMEQEGI
ncbi:MAG TPA: CopG family transcriptional regulator [Candidatus Binatia bacterium]|nr:CopG family transcriptional regulator [Candidatus Binatia bacterium]